MTRKVLKKKRDRKRKTIKRHVLKKTRRIRLNYLNTKKQSNKLKRHKRKYTGGGKEDVQRVRDLFNELFDTERIMTQSDRTIFMTNILVELKNNIIKDDQVNTSPLENAIYDINKIDINTFNNDPNLKNTLKKLISSLIDKCIRSNLKKGVNFDPLSQIHEIPTNEEIRAEEIIRETEEREARLLEQRLRNTGSFKKPSSKPPSSPAPVSVASEEVFQGFDEPEPEPIPKPWDQPFNEDFYSRNEIYTLNRNSGLRLKNFYNNYTLIETTQNGNCFYNAYFQLAHRFKSNANLYPFTNYHLEPETACDKTNELKWVDCFKKDIADRLNHMSDKELSEAFRIMLNQILTIHLKEYMENPDKKQNEYEFQKLLNDKSDFNPDHDTTMIEVFTKRLPQLLNQNKGIIQVLIDKLKLIDNDNNEEHKEVKKETTISEFITTREGISDFENEIDLYYIFRAALIKKLQIPFAYATSIEIGIIQKCINLKYDRDIKLSKGKPDDRNIIPIINALGPYSLNSNSIKAELDEKKRERQFIFYKTGPTGRHYDAVFSEMAAPEIPGSPKDKIFEEEWFGVDEDIFELNPLKISSQPPSSPKPQIIPRQKKANKSSPKPPSLKPRVIGKK